MNTRPVGDTRAPRRALGQAAEVLRRRRLDFRCAGGPTYRILRPVTSRGVVRVGQRSGRAQAAPTRAQGGPPTMDALKTLLSYFLAYALIGAAIAVGVGLVYILGRGCL